MSKTTSVAVKEEVKEVLADQRGMTLELVKDQELFQFQGLPSTLDLLAPNSQIAHPPIETHDPDCPARLSCQIPPPPTWTDSETRASQIPKQGKAARDRISSCQVRTNFPWDQLLNPADLFPLVTQVVKLMGLREQSKQAQPRHSGNVFKCLIQKVQATCQRINY